MAFDYKVDVSTIKRKDTVHIYPLFGKIEKKGKEKINIYYTPQVPKKRIEKFYVYVAHFEPTCMTIKANGIYPKIHIPDLPVIKTPRFKKIEQIVL